MYGYGISRVIFMFFFFQAEDGIRDVERSRGLGDVYKRQTRTTGVSSSIARHCRFETGSLTELEAYQFG